MQLSQMFQGKNSLLKSSESQIQSYVSKKNEMFFNRVTRKFVHERKPAQTRNPNNARLFESLVESGLTKNSPNREQAVTPETSSPKMKRLTTEVNQSKLSINRDSVLSIDSGSYLLPFNPK